MIHLRRIYITDWIIVRC